MPDALDPLIGAGDDRSLALRLAEAAAWCAPRVDVTNLEGCLRSAELAPPGGAWEALAAGDEAAVRAVVRRRASEVGDVPPIGSADQLGGGRLLAYFLHNSLVYGFDSSRYLDEMDVPPWDTWVLQVPEPSPSSIQ